jgi:hypothetical protein
MVNFTEPGSGFERTARGSGSLGWSDWRLDHVHRDRRRRSRAPQARGASSARGRSCGVEMTGDHVGCLHHEVAQTARRRWAIMASRLVVVDSS